MPGLAILKQTFFGTLNYNVIAYCFTADPQRVETGWYLVPTSTLTAVMVAKRFKEETMYFFCSCLDEAQHGSLQERQPYKRALGQDADSGF